MAADPDFAAGQRLPASKLLQLSPDPVLFTPVWGSVTFGTTGLVNEGYAWRVGRQVHYVIELILGTGGDVTSTLTVDYPTPADPALATSFVAAAWCSLGSGTRYGGTGIGDAGGITRFASENTATGWNATVPINWVAGSQLRVQGSYIEA